MLETRNKGLEDQPDVSATGPGPKTTSQENGVVVSIVCGLNPM